jgi:hypothetical protein
MRDSDPILWKVNTYTDTGGWYFSGPFTSHRRAEEFCVSQAVHEGVLSCIVSRWEEDISKPAAVDLDAMMRMFRETGKG